MNHSTPDAHSSSLESNTLSELYPLDPQRAWPRGISQLEDSLSLLTQALSEVFSAERESPVRASCDPDILSEQLNLTLTPAELTTILTSTSTDLGAPGKDNLYGHGLVNAFAACQSVMGGGGGGPQRRGPGALPP